MLFVLYPRAISTTIRLIGINMKPHRKFSKIFVKLPKFLMKDYVVLPTVSWQGGDLGQCRYAWYREITRHEREAILESKKEEDDHQLDKEGRAFWYKLSDQSTYTPREEDVARRLRLVCWLTDGENNSPKYRAISECPVGVGPTSCPFELRHENTKEKISEPAKFRVVTYNILADLYADSDYSRSVLFAHCPANALEIDYRRQLLLKEILGYNADIVCLQEVDKKEFLRVHEPFLKTLGGMTGIFDPKGSHSQEGLAMFYRDEKFQLIDSHRTRLTDLLGAHSSDPDKSESLDTKGSSCTDGDKSVKTSTVDSNSKHPIFGSSDEALIADVLGKFVEIRQVVHSNPKLKERFEERNTVLQTSLLKINQMPGNYIIISNTHFYFAPDADHIRLLQGSISAKYIEHIKDFYRSLILKTSTVTTIVEPHIDIVFCGDFNSSPDCGTYKLLTEGKITQDLPDWLSNGEEVVVGLNVETNLRLSSAYEGIEYTNYTPEFKGCLDYIYYERDGLKCDSIVPLPNHEDVIATGGIPSEVFPSDHLALIANLELINN